MSLMKWVMLCRNLLELVMISCHLLKYVGTYMNIHVGMGWNALKWVPMGRNGFKSVGISKIS